MTDSSTPGHGVRVLGFAGSHGGTMTFTLVMSNAGPSPATNAAFQDILPTGLGTVTNVVSAVEIVEV